MAMVDEIYELVLNKLMQEKDKLARESFRLNLNSDYFDGIKFPNGNYIIDRYKEYITTLDAKCFEPNKKEKNAEFEIINKKDVMPYISHDFTIEPNGFGKLCLWYEVDETLDDIVNRIYNNSLEYAKDYRRKEFLKEHHDFKMYNVKLFYGNWISDLKPINFRGLNQGDFLSVKIKYDNGADFDIKLGIIDFECNDNPYNIVVKNVNSDYKIISWLPIPN